MSRLVTGLFYDRSEAEGAVASLRAGGVDPADIYLEREVALIGDVGCKGGEVSAVEQERRFAGLETGLIIGAAVGLIAGMGMGMLGSGMSHLVDAQEGARVPSLLFNPALSMLTGLVIGLMVGGLIGWIVDSTLNRLGAGPARPMEETLVTVRTHEDAMDDIYAMLFRARARHLHVADHAV